METDTPTGSGFRKSTKILCTTAASTPVAGANFNFRQRLEGQDLQRIRKGTSDAQQLTVSFWVKANVTGTYVLELFDLDNTRHVAATYSVSASATWERKVITFPADTAGVLDNDADASLMAVWWLAGGSDFTSGTLPSTWASNTNANRAVGQTNLAAATNNYWQVTGVQLETGPVATPFEFEPYEATLRKCQRYYYLHTSGQASKSISVGMWYGATQVRGYIQFPTTMRTAPSLVASTGTNFYKCWKGDGSGDDFNDLLINRANIYGSGFYNDGGVSGTGGHATIIEAESASASVAFDAEL